MCRSVPHTPQAPIWMSAAFLGIFGHSTDRITGSAPGPAKVATRMVLLRMEVSEVRQTLSALLHAMEERSRNRYDHSDSRQCRYSGRGKVYVGRVRRMIPVRVMQCRFTSTNLAVAVHLLVLLVVLAICSGGTAVAQTGSPVLGALAAK